MSCSCRIAAWRTFARGLAQIHRPEASTAAQFHRRVTAFGQSRGIQASKFHRQDGGATAVVVERIEEVESQSQGTGTVVEDARAATTKPLGETPLRGDVGTDKQPVERTRVKKDRHRDRRAVASNHAESSMGEKDESHDRTSIARRERKAVSTSRDSPVADSADASPTSRRKNQEPWQLQKAALKEKFPEGWQPRKRLSPDALAGIRALNAQFPEIYTTEALADKFQVSSEAIRRIIKSHWRPSSMEEEDRQQRWFRRGKQVWEQKAALGIKPPQRWRVEGVARDPGYHEWSKKVSQREREWEEEENRKYRAHLEKRKRKKTEFTKGW
ncbi:hypothetical protein TGAM01_v208316 [Trichoderma gamsii]|uniref:Required for respiratory growth protein 9, mitochondrial n=1 Tax=Trichoderma gamsii TaxID=398673 RepID=A0A2P4ZEV9_9HYPO|nr:hypothetical protein TGAM01_v208316 [Trichoderma gamsii]PON22836.1 hypothetical protein TGAM01_v208316 [Trichoderma gamsii]